MTRLDKSRRHTVFASQSCRAPTGVGETCRLEEDVVEVASSFHQLFQSVDAEVFDGAAEAAIAEFHPFLKQFTRVSDGQRGFHSRTLTKFIENDSDSFAVLFGKDIIQ